MLEFTPFILAHDNSIIGLPGVDFIKLGAQHEAKCQTFCGVKVGCRRRVQMDRAMKNAQL